MHISKREATELSVPAERIVKTVAVGQEVKSADGMTCVKVLEIPKGRGSRVVLEIVSVKMTRPIEE